ncbi:SCP-like protein [Ostertagia ostertagi]
MVTRSCIIADQCLKRWSCGLERLAREAVQGCPSEIPENPLYTRSVLHLSNEQRNVLYHKEELDDPLKMRFNDFASGRSRYQWGNMVLNFQGPEGLSMRECALRGKMKKFSGKSFKKAADMEKMEYDCDLEADAMIYAETCALVPSYPSARKGQGENVAVVEPQSAESFEKAAQAADVLLRPCDRGSDRLGKDDTIGVREVIFKERHRNTPVALATQIVWSTTNKVGCAIGKCGGSYFVVCRYSPRGNQVDHEVYKIGTPCSQCPSKRCDTAMGLCIMP